MLRPAVFLDRDGTINQEVGYLNHPDQLELIAGAAAAVRQLNKAGLMAVVISNQAGIAKGLIREEMMTAIHATFVAMLAREGAAIDGFYFCPHHPEGTVTPYARICDCRKPAPGLVHRAAAELGIDLRGSYVVGDKVSDVRLAHNVGATAVMVLTGHGSHELQTYPAEYEPPRYVARDLSDAVQWILRHIAVR